MVPRRNSPSLMTSSLSRPDEARFPVFLCTLLSLALLLAMDHTSMDLRMARWFGSTAGFPLEHHWALQGLLHDWIKYLPWTVELMLLVAVFRPFGSFRSLPGERRVQLALTTFVALLIVSMIKLHSRTSCPWDLQEFGGVAHYVSHWSWGVTDGGTGGCFPAGHASAGFAFLGGYFAFRHTLPRTAQRWLAGALVAGLLLGIAQQMRGAHYFSHTLWTAWLCWTAAGVVDDLFTQMISQKRSPVPALAPAAAALRPWQPPA